MKTIFACIVLAGMAAFAGPSQQFPKDPVKDMQKRAEKEAGEKNYKELKDAVAELAELSKQIQSDVDEGGKDVISVRIFDKLDKVEKLTKRIRDKARGNPAAVPKVN